MASEAEKDEIAAQVAAELGTDQVGTGHPVAEDEAPRGNVHGEVSEDDAPGGMPPPFAP